MGHYTERMGTLAGVEHAIVNMISTTCVTIAIVIHIIIAIAISVRSAFVIDHIIPHDLCWN